MAGEIDAFLRFSAGKVGRGSALPIIGETLDAEEREAIKRSEDDATGSVQIRSYSFKCNCDWDQTEETASAKGGNSQHHPKFEGLQVTKPVDTASPNLLAALCTAAQFDKVTLRQRRAGGLKDRSGDYFWRITLFNVHVADLSWQPAGDGGYPEESLTLVFDTLEVEYLPQLSHGGHDKSRTGRKYTYELQGPPTQKKGDGTGSTGSLSDTQVDAIVAKVMEKLNKSGGTKGGLAHK